MMEIAETSFLNSEAIISPDNIEELKKPGRKKRTPLSSRFAEPCSSNSEFKATRDYDLDTEDASFVLRRLENAAFQAVVDAFRTQGPLTPYKELLLEHLRFALFIREHDFIQVIQEAADNAFLQKVCKNLNQSSSCSAQWRALSFPAHTPTNAYIRSQSSSSSSSMIENRTKLMTTIGCHNVSVKDLDIATAKLCSLKKEKYIPQQLRRVLYDTELSAGRVDINPFDLNEEEMRRDFVDYEKEKDRIANEIVEEEKNRNGKHRRGKKRKVTLPPFYNHTIRAQARANRDAQKEENNEGKDDDVIDEDEQCQAEADMMKLIESQDKMVAEAKEKPEVSPHKYGHKMRKESKKKLKEPKERVQVQSQPLKFSTPEPAATSKPIFTHVTKPSHHQPSTAAQIEIIHPPQKHNRTDEQRAMDENLVLIKTAQAMIEDLENTNEPENGLTPAKRKKQKHDGTPKKRGRKPAESKDNPITCARTTPFLFEGKSYDPNKAPRGNPDKKAKKHAAELKSPPHVPTTNGVAVEKPAPSSPASQPRLPAPAAPKTAIIPVSSSTIVIRPRNPSISTPPSTSLANVTEISPAKKMRFTSESIPQIQGTPMTGQMQMDANRVFPVVRQTGRPTLFRPPNVVFPRSANVLNNGTPRYAVPFTTQSSANPTGPYYGNPSFAKRATVSRERPQLHTFTRPTTSVIRLVTTELKAEEISNGQTQQSGPSTVANGMRSRSIDNPLPTTITKASKEGETLLLNGIIPTQESNASSQQAPLSILSQNPSTSSSSSANSSSNIQFSTSFPPSISTTTQPAAAAASSSSDAQMISIRPHFPLTSNIQNPTMINLQAVTISSKPSSSLYQVVNAPSSQVYMQQNIPTQIVQTAIPVMLHTVATSNFATHPQQPSLINVPLRPPAPMIPIEKSLAKLERGIPKAEIKKADENLIEIQIPFPTQESVDLNHSYSSSNESYEIPPPPPPPPDEPKKAASELMQIETPPVEASQKIPIKLKLPEQQPSNFYPSQILTNPQGPIYEPEVVINGVDPRISASVQSMIDRNHSIQQMFTSPPPPSLHLIQLTEQQQQQQQQIEAANIDISESHQNDESQNHSTSVSQKPSIENAPANT